MLNWLKFISIFLLALLVVITVTVVYNANKPFANVKKEAKSIALQSEQLVSVQSVQIYNSDESYATVFGIDENEEEIALFIDLNSKDEQFKKVVLSEGITADEAIQVVEDEHDVHQLLHVSLGWEEEGPVWEVAFKNTNDHLNYVYVFFEDAQWWKRILNL